MEEKKSAIFNIYARRDQMKEALGKVIEDSDRNAKFIELLSKGSEEDKKKYEIDSFIKDVERQNDSYKEQEKQLADMIAKTEQVITAYENDKDKYGEFLNNVLLSFGCKETEVKEDK